MVFMETGQNAPLRGLARLLAKEGHAHSVFWRLVLAVAASCHCTKRGPSALLQWCGCLKNACEVLTTPNNQDRKDSLRREGVYRGIQAS